MITYAALLRGVNVAGRAKVLMTDLRTAFAGLGFEGVSTYLQSGNVVFETETPRAALGADIEARLGAELGLRTTVLLRSGAELAAVVAANPFLGRQDDPAKLHVTFVAEDPDRALIPGLSALAAEGEEVAVVGRDVYLHCPHGYGRSKLTNTAVERRLAVLGTTRNWRTVLALRDRTAA
ncbi:DUF1697 domain-containing protein [Frankia sp. CNm7]|uniref:DUF1697 domain-containing protein n=1 Tax=Frankia nepalensis TaxID=1836974 RepID=A0A937USG1_9ACTN|nr:DUF1697 domain-containing protein [Frankia nepalensis]MBL7502002.1 DUF1697 domain-containing protein [Frankia nepalensis]MBL7516345.1 DUF1697 domain-containing protein [Frankia nepalensis]MBL7519746.1 DUF1697 domain-containing protein [Frankia nepalensis]MBL7632083.1 DUF1697 domain-containing protein [Frankia nepalensis]